MYLYLIEIFLVIYSLELDLQIIFVQVTRKYFLQEVVNIVLIKRSKLFTVETCRVRH